MPYRSPMRVGDRVALAPHLDLWVAGVRFGVVIERMASETGTMLLIDYGAGVDDRTVWLDSDDLLGAVR